MIWCVFFNYVFRIVQRLGEWCKATILPRTAPRPFLRREIRFLLTAVTLLIRPEPTFFPKMLRRGLGLREWEFSLKRYSEVFEDNPTLCFSLRYLQREMENQKGQVAHIQQQIRRLDEDIRQNQELLRRANTEQRTTKVTHLRSVWNRSYYYLHFYQMHTFKTNKYLHCRKYKSKI